MFRLRLEPARDFDSIFYHKLRMETLNFGPEIMEAYYWERIKPKKIIWMWRFTSKRSSRIKHISVGKQNMTEDIIWRKHEANDNKT